MNNTVTSASFSLPYKPESDLTSRQGAAF